MNTYYLPVHFYEQETTEDNLIMITTKQNIKERDLIERLGNIKARYTGYSDDCSTNDGMLIIILNDLTDEIGGIWSYCKTLPQLVIGGSGEHDEYTGELNLKPVRIEELASLLTRLNPGESLYFYETPKAEPDESGYSFCATMINNFGSYAVYINCRDGGLPFVADLTTYYQDMKKLITALNGYFSGIDGNYDCVYVDSDIMGENLIDE